MTPGKTTSFTPCGSVTTVVLDVSTLAAQVMLPSTFCPLLATGTRRVSLVSQFEQLLAFYYAHIRPLQSSATSTHSTASEEEQRRKFTPN